MDAATNVIFKYQYDASGRMTNRWSAAKGDTGYAYDATGNLTNVNYPSNTDIAMAYDALGRLTNLVDAVGTTGYSFGNRGRLTSEAMLRRDRRGRQAGPWTDDTVAYTYFDNGLRQTVAVDYPGESWDWTVTNAWDGALRLTSVSSPGRFVRLLLH